MDNPAPDNFAIRTLAAGIHLESLEALQPVEEAVRFLANGRRIFEEAGYEVQSTRLLTQSLAGLASGPGLTRSLEGLRRLDRYVADRHQLISIGPLLMEDIGDPALPRWTADLLAATEEMYCSVTVADPIAGVLPRAVRTAARTMKAISRISADGEANFRFGAAARIPAGTPFFPVAHHSGPAAFSIGLESAGLVAAAFQGHDDRETAGVALRSRLEASLSPIQALAETLAAESSRRYLGIDLSPAPSIEVSIGEPIEALTGQPFGTPTTLSACATITQGLKSTHLTSCGYSGLMLPLLEDRVLARRAAEQRFGVQDLLFYSSVCGTGLDVIPVPGDCREDDLAGLILDMAVLATRLQKPLAARLLPIPGKCAGEEVSFANPHLTSSVVLPVR